MATSMEGPFDVWLTNTLLAASSDIDTDVFVSYIIGILEEDDTPDDEKKEGIFGLLSSVVVSLFKFVFFPTSTSTGCSTLSHSHSGTNKALLSKTMTKRLDYRMRYFVATGPVP